MSFLEDFFYPPHCLHCQKPGDWLCFACRSQIKFFTEPVAAPAMPSGAELMVSRIFACGSYKQRAWAKTIASLKYAGVTDVRSILVGMIKAYHQQLGSAWIFGEGEGWTIVAAPTNPDHILERGQNHLDTWIAVFREILPAANVEPELLRRRSHALAHASLHHSGAREAAVQETIVLSDPSPTRVIVIDDVYTTGATAQECARCLYRGGAEVVEILVAGAAF